jgi:hypothetical protein
MTTLTRLAALAADTPVRAVSDAIGMALLVLMILAGFALP